MRYQAALRSDQVWTISILAVDDNGLDALGVNVSRLNVRNF